MRIVFAVVTGYLIFAGSAVLLFQVTAFDPHRTPSIMFGVFSVIWGMVFAGLGGYIAGRGARRSSLVPSILVGCLIASGALASLILSNQTDAGWSMWAALFLMAPSAVAGGRIHQATTR